MYSIAYIEDQVSIQNFVQKTLSDMAQVSFFNGVSQFNHHIRNSPQASFDLLLTDLYLPGEDSQDVMQLLLEQEIPVIIITGDQGIVTEAEVLAKGAFDYIRKPLNAEILKHRVGLHLMLRNEQKRVAQTQDKLIESDKLAALGQLAAGVAHEINNPVGFVTSNTNLVRKYIVNLTEALEELEQQANGETSGEALLLLTRWKVTSKIDRITSELIEISEESIEGLNRVKDIVRDLKDYAHTGEQAFESTDINRHLMSTVNLLRNEIKYKADIHTEFGDLPLVPCIASQINQVFVNIIVNACHAIEDFGEIILETREENDFAVIKISDNGSGMSESVRNRIFEPFYTTKSVGKGTGIGLAITKSIVDRHSGKIDVYSEPGIGTEFTVRLPLHHEHNEV